MALNEKLFVSATEKLINAGYSQDELSSMYDQLDEAQLTEFLSGVETQLGRLENTTPDQVDPVIGKTIPAEQTEAFRQKQMQLTDAPTPAQARQQATEKVNAESLGKITPSNALTGRPSGESMVADTAENVVAGARGFADTVMFGQLSKVEAALQTWFSHDLEGIEGFERALSEREAFATELALKNPVPTMTGSILAFINPAAQATKAVTGLGKVAQKVRGITGAASAPVQMISRNVSKAAAALGSKVPFAPRVATMALEGGMQAGAFAGVTSAARQLTEEGSVDFERVGNEAMAAGGMGLAVGAGLGTAIYGTIGAAKITGRAIKAGASKIMSNDAKKPVDNYTIATSKFGKNKAQLDAAKLKNLEDTKSLLTDLRRSLDDEAIAVAGSVTDDAAATATALNQAVKQAEDAFEAVVNPAIRQLDEKVAANQFQEAFNKMAAATQAAKEGIQAQYKVGMGTVLKANAGRVVNGLDEAIAPLLDDLSNSTYGVPVLKKTVDSAGGVKYTVDVTGLQQAGLAGKELQHARRALNFMLNAKGASYQKSVGLLNMLGSIADFSRAGGKDAVRSRLADTWQAVRGVLVASDESKMLDNVLKSYHSSKQLIDPLVNTLGKSATGEVAATSKFLDFFIKQAKELERVGAGTTKADDVFDLFTNQLGVLSKEQQDMFKLALNEHRVTMRNVEAGQRLIEGGKLRSLVEKLVRGKSLGSDNATLQELRALIGRHKADVMTLQYGANNAGMPEILQAALKDPLNKVAVTRAQQYLDDVAPQVKTAFTDEFNRAARLARIKGKSATVDKALTMLRRSKMPNGEQTSDLLSLMSTAEPKVAELLSKFAQRVDDAELMQLLEKYDPAMKANSIMANAAKQATASVLVGGLAGGKVTAILTGLNALGTMITNPAAVSILVSRLGMRLNEPVNRFAYRIARMSSTINGVLGMKETDNEPTDKRKQ